MTDTIIDLIRHGEPVGGSVYRGHTLDDPLSEKGWQQMWSAVGDYRDWQQIISSPMLRCHEFAKALSKKLHIPRVVDERIKEVGFGVWEGQTREQLKQYNLEQYRAFYRDPVNCRPPGAEDLNDFIARTTQAYDETMLRYSGMHSLLVTHAGVIRAVIAHIVMAAPAGMYKINVVNAGVTRIRHGGNGATLEFVNKQMC